MAEHWRLTTGRVVDGRIEVDEGVLEEGRRVRVLILDDEPVSVTEEERQMLLDAITDADRGETVGALELLASLGRSA